MIGLKTKHSDNLETSIINLHVINSNNTNNIIGAVQKVDCILDYEYNLPVLKIETFPSELDIYARVRYVDTVLETIRAWDKNIVLHIYTKKAVKYTR